MAVPPRACLAFACMWLEADAFLSILLPDGGVWSSGPEFVRATSESTVAMSDTLAKVS